MKIILSVVASKDGRVTDARGNPPSMWASGEDQRMFRTLIRRCGVVIIGSNTYTAQKESIRAARGALRVVMTSRPARYKKDARRGRLEFTSRSPSVVVASLSARGFSRSLLAGGPELVRTFLKAKLVNELWLTIEPVTFGKGLKMASVPKARLVLLRKQALNNKGTTLFKYRVTY